MDGGYRELAKAGFQGGAMDRIRLYVKVRAVEGALERDLPDVGGAEEDLVLGRFQYISACRIEPRGQ
jgi:hypothetical protein